MASERFECQISRHDHHNLEIKFNLESSRREVHADSELYFFFPATVKAGSWSKAELMSDFFSRFRLSLPHAREGAESLEEARREYLTAARRYSVRGADGETEEALLHATQRLGAVAGETLKSAKARHSRELLLAHSLVQSPRSPEQILVELLEGIERVARTVRELRAFLAPWMQEGLSYTPLLSEYLWHGYTQYLGELNAILAQVLTRASRFSSDYRPLWDTLQENLNRLAIEAAAEPGHHSPAGDADEQEGEQHLWKVSQLKKFFQSNMFVDVSRSRVVKLLSEPIAATAAGVGALSAGLGEWLLKPDFKEVGVQGAMLVFFGVVFYVLKDRLKDRGRHFLNRKLAQFLPDQDQHLITQNATVGRMREWFAIKKNRQLAGEWRALRRRHQFSEAESHLQEDVVHVVQQFDIRHPEGGPRRWAIHENLRINLERYLKHMDDPYKDMTLVDSAGHFSHLQAHRVYYFHAFVRTRVVDDTPAHRPLEAFTAVRIVMDKQGIQRVTPLEDPTSVMSPPVFPLPAMLGAAAPAP